MDGTTINRSEYSHKQGERYDASRPKDSDILRGDGSFMSDTHNRLEYPAKAGDRYEMKTQGASDIWKVRDSNLWKDLILMEFCAFKMGWSFKWHH
jgi:hypothetical protein